MGRNNGVFKQKKDRRSRHHKRTKVQARPTGTRSFQERLIDMQAFNTTALLRFDLRDLPPLIEEGREPEYVDLQYSLLTVCLRIILLQQMASAGGSRRNPKDEQVYTLRRLIYGDGDTLLVAATGWGKSIIFHAYSILTAKTTIQIIPLKKLGGEQLEDIRKLSHTNPCLLTSDTKKEEETLISQIRAGNHTHLLLGPEQASSKDFRDALKDPTFQSTIGLVAIDECHLVEQWKDFRAQFTMLGELRNILPRRIVWFGCSATLDEGAERLVLNGAGFRSVGSGRYQTEVVRTSINRGDIRLSIIPIPRRNLNNYSTLSFLLNKATSVDATGNVRIHPKELPKTIIFLDSKDQCEVLAQYLRRLLVLSTAKNLPRSRFEVDARNSAYDVFNVIQTFHASVQKYDQDVRYVEFLKPGSLIRLMVATTSLGMGMNIPDIKIVVNWKFPIGDSVSEAWQRAGRGG